MIARGEIWWYEEPDQKPRPYLIMTRNEAIPVLSALVGVPTTTRVRGIPSQVVLGRDDGMPTECALAFDELRVMGKPFLIRRITTLPPHRWPEVCAALRFTVAC